MSVGEVYSFGIGQKTVAFGTLINAIIPGQNGKKAKITSLRYTSAGTQHTLTFLRPLGKTTITALAAASQAICILLADPGLYTNKRTANNAIAANDIVLFKYPDGTYFQAIVLTAVAVGDGTITLTLTTNFPAAIAANSTMYFFGLIADVDPNTAEAHPTLAPPTSASTTYPVTSAIQGGVLFQTLVAGDPMIVQSSNATATGSIDSIGGVYGP